MKDYRLLSVIIPVYNEKSTVAEVIDRVVGVELPVKKEIIIVDDGSNDGTTEILETKRLIIKKIYSSPVNIGKGAAIRIGLSFADGDIILIQDADLELDPDEYKNLLQPFFEQDASVVYGSRFLKKNPTVPLTRRLANRFLTAVTNALYGLKLTDMETAYKVFTKEVKNSISLKTNKFDIEPEITARICQAGYKIFEVPVSYLPRTKFEGKKIKWQDGLKAVLTLFRCRFNYKNQK